MGNFCSCINAEDVIILVAKVVISELGLDFTLNEWINARKDGDVEQALQTMKTYATDLSTLSTSSMPQSIDKAVFLCINTYTKPDVTLGVGPMNDGINVADSMKKLNWPLYFLHNPTKQEYLKWLDFFLKNT